MSLKQAEPKPGTQGGYTVNPKTGLTDWLHGDYSFKHFVKLQWDWCLVWLVFFTVSLLQLVNFSTVIGWIGESYASDGFFAGLMVTVGMIFWIPTTIGLPIFLRKWWLQLGGWIDVTKKK